ncbi:MFS transporter [Candidatus Nitrosotalea okcheonensis]|uniref:Transporter, major facilitator family protein n=1 Tax=Candidatus Nitrosotalea okcheonensis TaxID=1903276 RepID=A0A2H1FE18_9ARCH|nr:MFS transporter [Candidatus Nitrosotalea okcheonensis]SMH71008.1 Transporter, major facilitator family protein [Candidatus Nitrosotalea okcheonensis]
MNLQWISQDGKLLLGAKIVRTFSYGFLSVVLAIYLKLIGFNDILIGLVLTATLVNSVFFNLFSSAYADKIGRRRILVIYAVLMIMSSLIFFVTDNYVALVIAALIGTINVTGSEVGAFLSLEQALLPQTVYDAKKRNSIFAIYNAAGTFAMSAGVLLAGLPSILQNYGFDKINAIKLLFLIYASCAIVVLVIYLALSKNVEVKDNVPKSGLSLKNISPKSRGIIAKMSSLFAVDSFGGGFVIQSIVSFWFYTKFGADLSSLSYIFAIAGILTAISYMASTRIASKIGLVNTMVFTHIPSNVLLILLALAPSFSIAISLYFARMSLSQMDVPTRQSYLMGVVGENERVNAAVFTNTSRNISQAISPSLTGIIISTLSLSAPFVVGGVLKIIYDVGIFFSFRKIKPPEEL